jgi:HAD superfamily hydrolase (TIGR01549 family)
MTTTGPRVPPAAILFDLDDTLFDHSYCAGAALEAVREQHDCFAGVERSELERRHAGILEELHLRVIAGEIGIDRARQDRFRRLFATVGLEAGEDLVAATAAAYKERYIQSWREVPGARALLSTLRAHARIGIISNNLAREQQEKLRFCGFDAHVDAAIISEEAGVSKPDPAIFGIALRALDCRPEEAVMIGDAWRTDVAGALAAGIRPIWFNRFRAPCPQPDAGVVEIGSLEPASIVIGAVFEFRRDAVSPRSPSRSRRQ